MDHFFNLNPFNLAITITLPPNLPPDRSHLEPWDPTHSPGTKGLLRPCLQWRPRKGTQHPTPGTNTWRPGDQTFKTFSMNYDTQECVIGRQKEKLTCSICYGHFLQFKSFIIVPRTTGKPGNNLEIIIHTYRHTYI